MNFQGCPSKDSTFEHITTILFDLDGTLRVDEPSSAKFFYDRAVELGVDDCPEKRRKAARWAHYYWAQSPDLLGDMHQFPEMDVEFWDNYAVRSLLAFDCPETCARELAPDLRRYMDDHYQPQDSVPRDVPETLQRLAKAGYRLGLLTNRSRSCQEHLALLGLEDYFEMTVVAGEVGAWKPDPIIFYHAIARLGIEPSQAMYVGDNYFADVVGAERVGILPVLVDPKSVFPDAQCPVIRSVGELCHLLEQDKPNRSC